MKQEYKQKQWLLEKYVSYFFIYSFIGWVLEVIITLFQMKEFENKVVIITGAGGYIGGETAVTLAKQGAKVAVCDISESGIQKTLDRIKEFGGIDLQLLGIGVDGHIGFNEPDSVFTGPTHEVKLDESTIEANARFFASKEEVPTTAITMGMLSIMQAKKVLLVANGAKKKAIVEKAFFGPIDPQVPASLLQLHPDVTVIFSEN